MNLNGITSSNSDGNSAVLAVGQPSILIAGHVGHDNVVLNTLNSGAGQDQLAFSIGGPGVVVALIVASLDVDRDVSGTEDDLGVHLSAHGVNCIEGELAVADNCESNRSAECLEGNSALNSSDGLTVVNNGEIALAGDGQSGAAEPASVPGGTGILDGASQFFQQVGVTLCAGQSQEGAVEDSLNSSHVPLVHFDVNILTANDFDLSGAIFALAEECVVIALADAEIQLNALGKLPSVQSDAQGTVFRGSPDVGLAISALFQSDIDLIDLFDSVVLAEQLVEINCGYICGKNIGYHRDNHCNYHKQGKHAFH